MPLPIFNNNSPFTPLYKASNSIGFPDITLNNPQITKAADTFSNILGPIGDKETTINFTRPTDTDLTNVTFDPKLPKLFTDRFREQLEANPLAPAFSDVPIGVRSEENLFNENQGVPEHAGLWSYTLAGDNNELALPPYAANVLSIDHGLVESFGNGNFSTRFGNIDDDSGEYFSLSYGRLGLGVGFTLTAADMPPEDKIPGRIGAASDFFVNIYARDGYTSKSNPLDYKGYSFVQNPNLNPSSIPEQDQPHETVSESAFVVPPSLLSTGPWSDHMPGSVLTHNTWQGFEHETKIIYRNALHTGEIRLDDLMLELDNIDTATSPLEVQSRLLDSIPLFDSFYSLIQNPVGNNEDRYF